MKSLSLGLYDQSGKVTNQPIQYVLSRFDSHLALYKIDQLSGFQGNDHLIEFHLTKSVDRKFLII